MKFVGEIGIPRREYLYELQYIDQIQIERGYERRNRHIWSISRWQTYMLMSVSMVDLKKAGIYKPTDILKFPWDDNDEEAGNLPDDNEIARLRQMMIEENAATEKRLKEQQTIQAEMDAISQQLAE